MILFYLCNQKALYHIKGFVNLSSPGDNYKLDFSFSEGYLLKQNYSARDF